LRCLKAEANAGKLRKLLQQLLNASKQVWHVSMGQSPMPPGPPSPI
jgi:hypothetical protein